MLGFIQEREVGAKYYAAKLKSLSWLRPQVEPDYCSQHAWQAFVCYVDPATAPLPRNEIMDILQQQGIATRPGTHAVHMLNYYKDAFGIKDTDYPGAMLANNCSMSIPLHNRMEADDYKYIVETLKAI